MSKYNVVSTVFLVLLFGSLSLDGSFNIPLFWYAFLVVLYLIINLYGMFFLNSAYFVNVISKGDQTANHISITFDDAPSEGKTEKVLEILKHYNVPATFFCIGNQVLKNSSLVKRMHNEGHLIGNHSFHHSRFFDFKSSSMITKELADTDALIHSLIEKRPKFFRPPFGLTQPMLAKVVRRRNYTVIGWSADASGLKSSDSNHLITQLTKYLKGGDIIRFHNSNEVTNDILPAFLQHVKEMGWRVVRLDDLVGEKPYA